MGIKVLTLDGQKVKLQIWDTAGQERFRTITTAYFRGAQGVILVYSATDYKSFENVRTWMASVQDHTAASCKVCLVSNKCDMTTSKIISTEDGQSLAEEFDVTSFHEVSAKSGHNIEPVFDTLARAILSNKQPDNDPQNHNNRVHVTNTN